MKKKVEQRKYSGYVTGGEGGEPWDRGFYDISIQDVEFLPAKEGKHSAWRYTAKVEDAHFEEGEKHIGRTLRIFFTNSPGGDYFGMRRHLGMLVAAGMIEEEDPYIDFENATLDLSEVVGAHVIALIEPDSNNPRFANVVAFKLDEEE